MLPKTLKWRRTKNCFRAAKIIFRCHFYDSRMDEFFRMWDHRLKKNSYTCSLSYGQDARRKKRDIGRSLWIGISSIQMSECCLLYIYIVKFDSNDVVEFPSLFFVHRGNHATGWRNIFRQSMLSRWLRNSSTRLVFSTVCSRCQHKNKHAREDG